MDPIFVVLLLTVPGSEGFKQEPEEDGQTQNWDCKKVTLSILHKHL